MIWNPLKKKQDAGSEAAKAPEPSAPQVSENDRTDPLLGTGQLEERTELLSAEGTAVELEGVELWDRDGMTDRFLRLSCKDDNEHTAAIRRILLEAPEHATGFRDLLFSNSHALRAKLDCPEHTLADLPALLQSGSVKLRSTDLLAGLSDLALFLAFAGARLGLSPAVLTPAHIGMVHEPHRIAGFSRWHFTFVGWDALAPGDAGEALRQLVGLFREAAGQLAAHARDVSLPRIAESIEMFFDRIGGLEQDARLLVEPAQRHDSWQPAVGIHGATDVGKRREHNEDAFIREQLDLHSATGARLTLAAVADGMGGHASGEVASSLALALLRQQLGIALLAPTTRQVDVSQLKPHLESIIPAIDRALTERAELDPALAGMGTTLVGYCALCQQSTLGGLSDQTAAMFWVGDSRAYLLGPCGMLPLSRDHSYVQELMDGGSITAEEARSHQMKNVITRCLGGAGNAGVPDVIQFTPGPGEAILLASDGLTDAIDDAQIWDVVRKHADAGWDAVLQALIDAANAAGGPDNITVVIVEFRARG